MRTKDGSTVTIYIDGAEDVQGTCTGTITFGAYPLVFPGLTVAHPRALAGIIDEVHYSTPRSPAQISMQYANMYDPTSFYALGPLESLAGATVPGRRPHLVPPRFAVQRPRRYRPRAKRAKPRDPSAKDRPQRAAAPSATPSRSRRASKLSPTGASARRGRRGYESPFSMCSIPRRACRSTARR